MSNWAHDHGHVVENTLIASVRSHKAAGRCKRNPAHLEDTKNRKAVGVRLQCLKDADDEHILNLNDARPPSVTMYKVRSQWRISGFLRTCDHVR